MSTFVKHEAPRGKGTKLALILGILWLAVLAAFWFAYRGDEGDGGGWVNFIGRFHVLIVHVPIGVIFIALLMDVLTRLTAFSHLRSSLPFLLWMSFLSAIAATVVGYMLMSVEGFEGRAMNLHMWFGLGVTAAVLVALIACLKNKGALATLGLALAAFCTAASGHFGGAMVHTPDYLTEHAPEPIKPLLLVGLGHHESGEPTGGEGPGGEDPEAVEELPLGERVVYTDFVVPILEAKCNECHNENKIKGKLRMDTHELLLAGADGSDFPTVVPGDAEASEMIVRVTLEQDHDEFMPPKGDPLTAEEIKLLSLWIMAGAKQETKLAELGDDPEIEATALAVEAIHGGAEEVAEAVVATVGSAWDTLSPEEQQTRMEEVELAAEKYRFSVMPISAEDDRLRVNVINAAKEFGDDQLALLEPVASRIAWLDLARSQVTDEGMGTVAQMRGLERLHLENTAVSDVGIAKLGELPHLEYLNLYGTKVGNGVFESFAGMPALKKVYLWQTAVDPAQAKAYERSVNLEINTGVDLAAAAASGGEDGGGEAEKKEDEKKEAPAPKAEEKKADTPPAKKEEAKPAAAPAKADTPPAPKPAAKPADQPKPATPAPAAKKEEAKSAPAKADTPPAKKEEAKPAPATPAKADAAPTPKPEAKPAPKTDTPAPGSKPAADPKPAAESKPQ